MKRRALAAVFLLAAGGACLNPPPVAAAARLAADQTISPAELDQSLLDQLRQDMGDLPQTNPKAALARYTQFFADRPALSAPVAIEVSSAMAKLYQDGLKDNARAIETYRWAVQKYGRDPRSVPLVLEEARLLEADGDETAAAAAYQDALPAILKGWPQNANEPLDDYTRLLLKSGKTDDVIQVLGKMLVMQPLYLDPGPPNWDWVYPRLIEALQAAGQPRGAMRWARLRFMEAAYSAESMSKAARLVAKTWKAADPDGSAEKAFVAAETDPALPNPLADFTMPKLDEQTVKSRLAGATGPDRISIEIAAGQFKEAMQDARDMAAGAKTAKEGILQVCRVFKAADLNLTRANAYLTYLKTGQGEDPVAAFLKQTSAAAVKAASVAPGGSGK